MDHRGGSVVGPWWVHDASVVGSCWVHDAFVVLTNSHESEMIVLYT